MTNEEYAGVQAQIVAFASIVDGIPLAAFIETGERALSAGPVLDPTLWRQGHGRLENLLKAARALRAFQVEVEAQVEAR